MGAPKWTFRSKNVSISPSDDVAVGVPSWNVFPMIYQIKITNGIDMAPGMIRSALKFLKEHAKLKAVASANPIDTESGKALRKYFQLQHGGNQINRDCYWKYVDGVISVYETIRKGISAEYDLVISDIGCRAGVEFSDSGRSWMPVSPIRAAFGFIDEWGHVPWSQGAYGKAGAILIAYDYIVDGRTSAVDLARTIVHEGSHKWARTKDILYKAQSLGQIVSDDQTAQELGQQLIQVPGRAKAFRPLTGLTMTGDLIADERYLENADSYAWAARRLFKRDMSGIRPS